jgi:hypothetical protein
MTTKSCNAEPWTPARYLQEHSFDRRPLILGEAPSPTAPDSPWVAEAKSTHNLIALIYGACGSHSDLVRDFELSNVFESHPGKNQSGFSKFDRLPGASTLQQLSGDGVFHNRVTFFMGRRVSQALASTDSFEQAIDRRSKLKFKPTVGWIDWVPVESLPNSFGLFMMVPHPQAYCRYGDGNLKELSRLFRLALGLSPVSKLGTFRSR